MNVKKFAHDKMKKLKYQKYLLKQNKENYDIVTNDNHKQFSVDLHMLSQQHYGYTKQNKNLINEDIPIWLENSCQNRRFRQKNKLENQLFRLNEKISQNDQESLIQILERQSDQVASNLLINLIETIKKKLQQQKLPQKQFAKEKNYKFQQASSKVTKASLNDVSFMVQEEISQLQKLLLGLQSEREEAIDMKSKTIDKKKQQILRLQRICTEQQKNLENGWH